MKSAEREDSEAKVIGSERKQRRREAFAICHHRQRARLSSCSLGQTSLPCLPCTLSTSGTYVHAMGTSSSSTYDDVAVEAKSSEVGVSEGNWGI